MDAGIALGWIIIIGLIGGIVYLTWRGMRHMRLRREIQAYLEAQVHDDPGMIRFLESGNRFRIEIINGEKAEADEGVFTLSEQHISIYRFKPRIEEVIRFAPEQIRWFGRPEKYHSGKNEIWLHVERKRDWVLVRLWMWEGTMHSFVRTLKGLVPPELVTAYRRRRPYIHYGVVEARPAEQDIHGAWALGEAVNLYLMPRYLLVLQGVTVQRVMPLVDVQQIGALRRLDAPQADGLVRFRTPDGETAYAMRPHEAFAQALAEAAKRTLEAPLEQKQKGKYEDWEWEED